MKNEEIIFGIIVNGGNARSNSMRAIKLARKGDFEEAKKNLKLADEDLSKAHGIQIKLIQDEAAGIKTEVSLLMVHAQDHLMNAMTVRDLAGEFVDMYENGVNNK